MRTEVKIGIVVGLVVVALGVFFFVRQGRQASQNVAEVLPVDAPAKRVVGGAEPPKSARPPAATPSVARRPLATPGTRPAPDTGLIRTPPPALSGGPTTRPAVLSRPEPEPEPAPALTEARAEGEQRTTPSPGASIELPPLVTRAPGGTLSPAVTTTAPAATPTPLVALPPRRETPAPSLALPAAVPAVAVPQKHTIAEGDSMWGIAEKYYGDGHLWPRIKAANPGVDENRLLVGTTLVIPPKEQTGKSEEAERTVKPASTGGSESREMPAYTYVVEEGDTLVSIARRVLGDASRWREIYELNKGQIANPDVLYVGTKLRMPPREKSAAERHPATNRR